MTDDAPLNIRPLRPADHAALPAILMPVIRAGETYALDPAMSEAAALGYWLAPDKTVFVAERGGRILGTYYLRANQAGGGAHVANAGYMTAQGAGGQGVGRAMAEHSLVQARAMGFRAMQFNFVISSNTRAVRLWQALGFAIVGTLPDAFRRPDGVEVDALVMLRRL